MKITIRLFALLLTLVLFTLSFAACNKTATDNGAGTGAGTTDGGETETQPSLWDGATYKENTTLGEGQYTLAITMEMEDKSILLTVKTNADNVKDALLEVGLIDGEQQAIGYLMSTLNGVRADYTLDGAYWMFCQAGEMLFYGIDAAPVAGEVAYEFVYTPA